jgi:uncharacterized repeat protein (TIGR03803 family)
MRFLTGVVIGCWQVCAGSCAAQTIYDFLGPPNPADPLAGLVLGTSGVLYGPTIEGGPGNFGSIYALTPPTAGHTNWTETTLYSFGGQPDGRGPRAGLYAAADGSLYGTTADGGSANPSYCNFYAGCGTFFRLIPPAAGKTTWTEQVLYSFDGSTDGYYPISVPLPDGSGGFYVTVTQGAAGHGTIMDLTPPASGTAWTGVVIHTFQGGADGDFPGYRLAIDPSGRLYGTTEYGGRTGAGTIFRLSPPTEPGGAWQAITLHAFNTDTDGAAPVAGVTLGRDGALYGTASYGGAYQLGTVFKLAPRVAGMPATFTVLHAFAGAPTDGAYPNGGVLLDPTGNVFGGTMEGGSDSSPCYSDGCGTVYRLSPPAWTETVLSQSDGGREPSGDLVRGADSALYGTTYLGGTGSGNNGTAFRVGSTQRK